MYSKSGLHIQCKHKHNHKTLAPVDHCDETINTEAQGTPVQWDSNRRNCQGTGKMSVIRSYNRRLSLYWGTFRYILLLLG